MDAFYWSLSEFFIENILGLEKRSNTVRYAKAIV